MRNTMVVGRGGWKMKIQGKNEEERMGKEKRRNSHQQRCKTP